jgi:hypothetical protein
MSSRRSRQSVGWKYKTGSRLIVWLVGWLDGCASSLEKVMKVGCCWIVAQLRGSNGGRKGAVPGGLSRGLRTTSQMAAQLSTFIAQSKALR